MKQISAQTLFAAALLFAPLLGVKTAPPAAAAEHIMHVVITGDICYWGEICLYDDDGQ